MDREYANLRDTEYTQGPSATAIKFATDTTCKFSRQRR